MHFSLMGLTFNSRMK